MPCFHLKPACMKILIMVGWDHGYHDRGIYLKLGSGIALKETSTTLPTEITDLE